uniref:Symplekin C-terminal domain-containing protein n=1 Tax=Palpitomonas bilix TaxID=652834 RepID=A0A7S3D8J4_9EUKA|mmetsp:Transcript_26728/g.68687  ORF Transcript_26728/g.68687 Transcript_26728/m.68687 type:complete len:1019 (+) Transcript_26728:56-3112(+)|eukprot:CAMPEP_0113906138 /NCGR_PEP_ID=MMETSP0780_2-20120614/24535_1 /TAXON_ID=652834 /ORGANISM="Palpitomonas bilix" /LENGTH=1018 /DNA_ID=CAMNT_0000900613 /DNA_START=34 /DNA_END=3090 /DNA_ORIENTATION=+ /assembly_acc=CAM_ASM_000599
MVKKRGAAAKKPQPPVEGSLLQRAFQLTSSSNVDSVAALCEEVKKVEGGDEGNELRTYAQLCYNTACVTEEALIGLCEGLASASCTESTPTSSAVYCAVRALPSAVRAATRLIIEKKSKTTVDVIQSLCFQGERFLLSPDVRLATASCMAMLGVVIMLTELLVNDDDGVPNDDVSLSSCWRVLKRGLRIPPFVPQQIIRELRSRIQRQVIAREVELFQSSECSEFTLRPLVQATARAMRYGKLSPSYLTPLDRVVTAEYLKLDEKDKRKVLLNELIKVVENSLRAHVRDPGEYFIRKIGVLKERADAKARHKAECERVKEEVKRIKAEMGDFKVAEKKELTPYQLEAIYYMNPLEMVEKVIDALKKVPKNLVAKGKEPKMPPLPEAPPEPALVELESPPWHEVTDVPVRWFAVKPVTAADRDYHRSAALGRLFSKTSELEASEGLRAETKLHHALVSRLLSDDDALVEFMKGNVKARNRVAVLWLVRKLAESGDADLQGPLHRILATYRDNLPLDDAGQAELPLNLPLVDKSVVDAVEKLMIENPVMYLDGASERAGTIPSHIKIGIAFFRYLILQRPAYRKYALPSLLAIALHPETTLSRPALAQVSTLYQSQSSLREEIFAFFNSRLALVKEGSGLSAEAIENRTRALSLFAEVLAYSNDEFLDVMVQVYVEGSAQIRKVIRNRWPRFVQKLWKEEKRRQKVLDIVEAPKKGAELLAVQALFSLSVDGTITAEVVDAAKQLYVLSVREERVWEKEEGEEVGHPMERAHALALVPIIAKLSPSEFASFLPSFLLLPTKALRLFVKKVFKTTVQPKDFLYSVHHQHEQDVPLKKQIEALDITLSQQDVITSEVCAQTLRKLVADKSLSPLLLRTALKVLELYPKLKPFMVRLTETLFSKSVWETTLLWKGVMQLYMRTLPDSLPLALVLPPKPFGELLRLRRGLAEHLQLKVGSRPLREGMREEIEAVAKADAAARAESKKREGRGKEDSEGGEKRRKIEGGSGSSEEARRDAVVKTE